MMTRWIVTAIAFLTLLVSGALAQPKGGKPLLLKGKVTDVGKDVLTVNHGNVEGFMGAMTMPYKVDKVDILSKIKAGDEIEATVYADDYTLYNVKVVPPAAGKTAEKGKTPAKGK
jgi:Cu/Ag efflux protein CusF